MDTGGVEKTDFLVVGAGLGGLIAAARLIGAEQGRVVVLERSTGVGGVWSANRYPNVAYDTPIELYSISFHASRGWSRNFAPGGEILKYLADFAETFGVTANIRFNTQVVSARWDGTTKGWLVSSADGRTWVARFVVWAGGILSQPAVPRLPGHERFQGEATHTTDWPSGASLDGKRVAVIGAGCTGWTS